MKEERERELFDERKNYAIFFLNDLKQKMGF